MRVIWPDELEDSQQVVAASRSRLFSGSEVDQSVGDVAEPRILPFATQGQRASEPSRRDDETVAGISPDEQSPADRARLIHRNSLCHRCHRALVSLILADDGRLDGAGEFVPGTQTLIGFRCDCCAAEWPAGSDQQPQRVANEQTLPERRRCRIFDGA